MQLDQTEVVIWGGGERVFIKIEDIKYSVQFLSLFVCFHCIEKAREISL